MQYAYTQCISIYLGTSYFLFSCCMATSSINRMFTQIQQVTKILGIYTHSLQKASQYSTFYLSCSSTKCYYAHVLLHILECWYDASGLSIKHLSGFSFILVRIDSEIFKVKQARNLDKLISQTITI